MIDWLIRQVPLRGPPDQILHQTLLIRCGIYLYGNTRGYSSNHLSDLVKFIGEITLYRKLADSGEFDQDELYLAMENTEPDENSIREFLCKTRKQRDADYLNGGPYDDE